MNPHGRYAHPYGRVCQFHHPAQITQIKKSPEKINFQGFVPGAGLEPARPQWSLDFKSNVSTNSTIRAILLGAISIKELFLKNKTRSDNARDRDFGAKDGIRTRDPDLGKVVLYQLSYFRL